MPRKPVDGLGNPTLPGGGKATKELFPPTHRQVQVRAEPANESRDWSLVASPGETGASRRDTPPAEKLQLNKLTNVSALGPSAPSLSKLTQSVIPGRPPTYLTGHPGLTPTESPRAVSIERGISHMLQTLFSFFEANILLVSLIAGICAGICGFVILRIAVNRFDDDLLVVSIVFLAVSLGLLSLGLHY